MNTIHLHAVFRKNNGFAFTSKGFVFHSSRMVANVTFCNFALKAVVKAIPDFMF